MVDTQMLTLIEAGLLLTTNIVGGAISALAWRVSDVDVRESKSWITVTDDPIEQARLRHNRRIITEDSRYGESRRLLAHGLIATVGIFWILTPQPSNPDVIWWAISVRATVVVLTLTLIDKTLHHLVARWRFDRPRSRASLLYAAGPAIRLAWMDVCSGEGRP